MEASSGRRLNGSTWPRHKIKDHNSGRHGLTTLSFTIQCQLIASKNVVSFRGSKGSCATTSSEDRGEERTAGGARQTIKKRAIVCSAGVLDKTSQDVNESGALLDEHRNRYSQCERQTHHAAKCVRNSAFHFTLAITINTIKLIGDENVVYVNSSSFKCSLIVSISPEVLSHSRNEMDDETCHGEVDLGVCINSRRLAVRGQSGARANDNDYARWSCQLSVHRGSEQCVRALTLSLLGELFAPTVFTKTSPPGITWQPRRCQSSGCIGTWRCASVTSADSANVSSSTFAFSLIVRFKSAAIGARSWSRILVLEFTDNPCVPSKRTLAVILPPGFYFRWAPSDAITKPGYLSLASDSDKTRT